MAGGYVAGRMLSRWYERGHEAEFRDGLHGALVWAVGVLISALLVFVTVGSVAKTGTNIATNVTGSVASSSGGMDTILDMMLRQTDTAPASAPVTSTTTSPGVPSRAGVSEDTRAEMSRLLAASVTTGSITPETALVSPNW
jgi:hypothetical protein